MTPRSDEAEVQRATLARCGGDAGNRGGGVITGNGNDGTGGGRVDNSGRDRDTDGGNSGSRRIDNGGGAGMQGPRPAPGGDDVVLVGTSNADKVPAVAASSHPRSRSLSSDTLLGMMSTMSGVVATLSAEVSQFRQEMQRRGKVMEDVSIFMNKLQQPGSSCGGTRRRDSDEEYVEFDELKTIVGGAPAEGGTPVLAEAMARLSSTGKKITALQMGTLKMLPIRRRVKARTFGDIGGATVTNKVLRDGDGDWEVMMEETMDELNVDAPEAYDFLTSVISSPSSSTTRRRPCKRQRKKGKAKAKGKANADSSSDGRTTSSSDNPTEKDKKKKKRKKPEKKRAYQPMTQTISHALEAIKKRVVPVWFEAVGSAVGTMNKAVATEWLQDMSKDLQQDGSPPPPPKEGETLHVRPRFICADEGHDGIVDALKEMFTFLAVGDRIKEPARRGDKQNVQSTSGHVAMIAAFVRAELEQIASGVRRKRRGNDNGWYDRWRWEVVTVRPLMPTTVTPCRGLIISDCNEPDRFTFEYPPVPINSIRTRVVRSRPDSSGVVTAAAAAEAAGEPGAGEGSAAAAAGGRVAVSDQGATGAAQEATAAAVGTTASAAGRSAAAAAAGGVRADLVATGEVGGRGSSLQGCSTGAAVVGVVAPVGASVTGAPVSGLHAGGTAAAAEAAPDASPSVATVDGGGVL